MNIKPVIFSLVKHENTSKNGQIKKIVGNFSENRLNNWTGFIRQRTGLIRQQRNLYHQNQRRKLLILRSYFDLLNYPFKEYFIHEL